MLHLLWDGHLGGVQRYVAAITGASHWAESQHGIVLFSQSGQVLNDATSAPLPVWCLGLQKGWHWIRSRRALGRILSEFPAEVIHCHCDTPAFLLNLKAFRDRKLIYHEHGDSLVRPASERYMHHFWRVNGRYWDRIIHNAQFSKKHFVKRYPSLESRSQVVPNPLTQQWDGRHAAFRPDAPVVGVFGRLARVKGVDRMVEVARLMKETRPDVQVHVYGDGECREELETQAEALGVSDLVHFKGYASDPLARMAEVDCVAVPSRIESFGLVALEAQSVGTPVVAFDGTGVAEIVRHGETGTLVPHGDLPAMAEALLAVLNDPDGAAALGQEARTRARTEFSLENHVRRLEQIYRSLAGHAGPCPH